MANLDTTTFSAALKEEYPDWAMKFLTYKNRPFFGLIQKDEKFGGELKKIPLVISNAQGLGALISDAQNYLTAPLSEAFKLTRTKYFVVSRLDREVMLASEKDTDAFMEAGKVLVETTLGGLSDYLSQGLFSDKVGVIGRADGAITSGVVNLTEPAQNVNFEVGMAVQAISADTEGATLRAGTGYVIEVNRTTGVVTVSATAGGSAGTPSGWTNNDYLIRASLKNKQIDGLKAWIVAASTVSSSLFYGVDRSADKVRLAGNFYDGSGDTIPEALTTIINMVAMQGGSPDLIVMNFDSLTALQNSLADKAVFVKVQTSDKALQAQVMYDGIQFNGPTGPIKVVADRNCEPRKAYVLQTDTLRLNSLKAAPHIADDNGEWLTVFNQDAYELRAAFYGNVSCSAPGWNGVVTLSE